MPMLVNFSGQVLEGLTLDRLAQLLDEWAPLTTVPLVPELMAPSCNNLTDLWNAVEAAAGKELNHAPFWSTPWPGGIALARWIFDHPQAFATRSCLDLGAGSGVAGMAAARAGARVVLNDVDPLALAVARITARANRTPVEFVGYDLTKSELAQYDIVLVGDGFYERTRALPLVRRLEVCARLGTMVLAADAERNVIALPGKCVLRLEVPVCEDIEGQRCRVASVHLIEP